MTKVAVIGAGKGGPCWRCSRTKAGHPAEGHHVRARVAQFQELERRSIQGTDERMNGSAGFTEARAHQTREVRSGGRARRG